MTRQEGYLFVDHRASPGTRIVPEGTVFESATKRCAHCAAVVVVNPLRTRARGYCPKCDDYVCDGCTGVMAETGYEHQSFAQVVDLVQSGKFTIAGGNSRKPLLVPVGDSNG